MPTPKQSLLRKRDHQTDFNEEYTSLNLNISCFVFVCGHVSFVSYAGDEASVIQWALMLVFFSTVTSVLRCGVVVLNKDSLVVVVNNAAHVRYAAVTHFHVVLVQDGVEIVVWWEVFLD